MIVTNAEELQDAVAHGVQQIVVEGEIGGMPSVALQPGQTLTGGTLVFGANGVRLTRDNTLIDITIRTADSERAILLDPTAADLGTLTLRNVRTVGQVALLVTGAASGHVRVEGLHIERADLRGRVERPQGFGVDAMQGAFTLWNRRTDTATITAELLDISAGSAALPVRGSGVFVGGEGRPDGGVPPRGRVQVTRLTTGEIHTDGGIAANTPDLISGGVFVHFGAEVVRVENLGPVTTYGQNDMVLDNWGSVQEWIAHAPIVSHGPSAMGFVQFGNIGTLRLEAPIETFGPGARGFNIFDGSLHEVFFHSVHTHGDGGVGIQIANDLPRLHVKEDVTTRGGPGKGLVKGAFQVLQAAALLVQKGSIGEISVGGALSSGGPDVMTMLAETSIGQLQIRNGIHASGQCSDGVVIVGDVNVPLAGIDITASDGEPIRRRPLVP